MKRAGRFNFVRCGRCDRKVHRTEAVYSRHTATFYCGSPRAQDRCTAEVNRQRALIALHYSNGSQGELFAASGKE